MSEIYTSIKATFPDAKAAKEARKRIDLALNANDWYLCRSCHSIQPIESYEAYAQPDLNVEQLEVKKQILDITAYSGRIEEPVWVVETLTFLGATRVFFRMQYDEGGSNYYFVDGKRVSKKKYDGDKPKKPLSARDLEINKNLFLPEGRVAVKATLVNHWDWGDMYESLGMEFVTEDGHTFYHKGTGNLTEVASDLISNTCEFVATFERGKLDGEYVSFARRPSKIKMKRAT